MSLGLVVPPPTFPMENISSQGNVAMGLDLHGWLERSQISMMSMGLVVPAPMVPMENISSQNNVAMELNLHGWFGRSRINLHDVHGLGGATTDVPNGEHLQPR
ncbi:hypothetical protein AV530_006187 [Patagioenas fasciata monilis]|uniref:Uncharacterized protein n=1 Tax=Patagioenas fasciata monilis TaxID=372326 RepID=A0A1V4KCU6_PATFA|nr:hypothetical protein AV530_006187 [Patagioenas fasciata monilis]